MKTWGHPSSPAEDLGLPESGSVLYSGPSKPPKRQANIVIEIPPWIPKKKTHVVRLPRGSRNSEGRIDGRFGENTASLETIVNLSTNDKAQLEWNTYLQGLQERGSGLDPDLKATWSPNSSANSQRGTTQRYSDHDKVDGYSDATDGISEGDTIFPISPCSHCSDDASEQATLLRRQPKRYHGSNSSSKSLKRKSPRSRSEPQFELGSAPPITLRFSIPTPPESTPYVDEYIHSLLAMPVFQPEATVTLEDIVWTEQVMQYDPDLKRFRYSILGVSETMDSDHLLILEEAYRANQVQIDRLRDEDYEFFGAVAEVNPDLVKLYFRWRRSLPDNISTATTDTIDSTDTPTTSLKAVGRERPKQSKDSQSLRNIKVYPVHSGTSRSDKEDDTEVICRKFLPQRHRVVQKTTCICFPMNVERCRGCILKRSDESCLFLDFRYFYIDSPRDGNHRQRYIYGPDFYSDPRVDKELSFNKTSLGVEESNYILAHIYTFARDLFNVEAQHVLHASVIADDATMNNRRIDYVRRPSNDRRFCCHCKISNVSGYWMCCVCSREFCMDCMERLSETTMCTKRRLHKKRQFVPCGRFHLSTLQSSIKSLKARTRLIPKNLVEDAKNALIGLDREPKSKGAGYKLKYRSAFTAEAEKVTREIFQENWRCGKVVVLSEIDKLKRINWSPDFLKQNYGDVLGTLWSIEPLAHAEASLRRFFEFRSVWKLLELTIRPSDEVLKDLYRNLMEALPMPDYTNPDGVFNLSRYFPTGHVGFNSSPKLFISRGLDANSTECGPFLMSCERSDHMYICVDTDTMSSDKKHAQESSSSPAVIWDIYRAEDYRFLSQFLPKPKKRALDPIIRRQHYLSPEKQYKLFEQTGIRPFQIAQNLGDAVMIPAGCVRQARFIRDSILVGVDFVSPERLSDTMARQNRQREFNLVKKVGLPTDVVLAKDILFYSTLAML